MFTLKRVAASAKTPYRSFSSTPARSLDVAKLILVGRLGKDPELRTSSTGKNYVAYTVATTNFPPPPSAPDGTRAPSRTSWHNVLSFNPNSFDYLRTLHKGSQVYVEAGYELREPDSLADPESPQGQRQIFLRHEMIRLLTRPHQAGSALESSEETTENNE